MKKLEINDNFDKEITGKLILVDFYADWCGPCQMLGPILEEIDFVEILKVNTDEHMELSTKYGVMSIPTMILFKDGIEVAREIGFHNKDQIEELVNEHQ